MMQRFIRYIRDLYICFHKLFQKQKLRESKKSVLIDNFLQEQKQLSFLEKHSRKVPARERQSPLSRLRDMPSAREPTRIEKGAVHKGFVLWTDIDDARLKDPKAPHPCVRIKLRVDSFVIFVNPLQDIVGNFGNPLTTSTMYYPLPDKQIANEALKLLAKESKDRGNPRLFSLKILMPEQLPGCRMNRHWRVFCEEV